jgi:hypothetical protein
MPTLSSLSQIRIASDTQQQPLQILLGIPGPPGIAAPIDEQIPDMAVPTANYTASMPLSSWRVVATDAAGLVGYASFDDSSALTVVGVTVSATPSGSDASVQMAGLFDYPPGGLIPNHPVLLGADGQLTQTPPTAGWFRQIGVAVRADKLLIDIGIPIFI